MPKPPSKKPKHGDYPAGCVVAYLRVSTAEQVASGAGLDAQREAVTAYAARAGLTVDEWCVDEGVSGSVPPTARPALAKALDILNRCTAGVLIVGKVDRIARKASDLLALRDLAEVQGWALSAADGSVDTATPHGRAMTTVMGAFAELERDLIRARTRDALAARKAAGVRLGRPTGLPDAVRARIAAERREGRTLGAIADRLTADTVPTAQGGARWYPSTVRAVLESVRLDSYSAGQPTEGDKR
jgi:DNA invertase Pin-like site-specific DNA recombinase